MIVNGCDERVGGCHITHQTIIDDNRRANEFRQTTEDNKCDAGNTTYCSYAENHPVETATFTATALIGGPALESFMLGGGFAGAMDAAYLAMRPALMPIYAWIARLFTRNPDSQTVSIGSYDPLKMRGYIEVAQANGYTHFAMNPLLNRALNVIGQARPINEGFMLNQISQAKDFFVTRLGPTYGSGTIMEMTILAENAYLRMTPMVNGITNIFLHPAIQP